MARGTKDRSYGDSMLNICLALLPVLLLLCGLLLMDSFKLLQPSSLAHALAWGALWR